MQAHMLGIGASLLVDAGSPDNLCSDAFTKEVQLVQPKHVDTHPFRGGGVGNGTNTATKRVIMEIGIDHQRNGMYTAPELQNSRIPGLLGRRSMKANRVVIDCYNNRFFTIGPGGYVLKLSPGSTTADLPESEAGHLMLPCSNLAPNQPTTMDFEVAVETIASDSEE